MTALGKFAEVYEYSCVCRMSALRGDASSLFQVLYQT